MKRNKGANNRDIFYKTMDIFNGAFDKNVKLQEGRRNVTDGKVISINFEEDGERKLLRRSSDFDLKHMMKIYPSITPRDDYYLLSCGHHQSVPPETITGGTLLIGTATVICNICSNFGGPYSAFEHEWSHIYFKSNMEAKAIFVAKFIQILTVKYQLNIDVSTSLNNFLHLFANMFEDFRVNSLQERIYAGSAERIWQRWKAIAKTQEISGLNGVISLGFKVGLGLDPSIPGPFTKEWESFYRPLIPVLDTALKAVKYKGPGTMYPIVVWATEQLIDIIVKIGENEQRNIDQGKKEQSASNSDRSTSTPENLIPSEANSSYPSTNSAPPQSKVLGSRAAALLRSVALASINSISSEIRNPITDVTVERLQKTNTEAYSSISGAINLALLDKSDFLPEINDLIDQDMQVQLQKLERIKHLTHNEYLLKDSKNEVQLIDVLPRNITKRTLLSPAQLRAAEGMRNTFFKIHSKYGFIPSDTGISVNIPNFVEFEIERQRGVNLNNDVFEDESYTRGFYYHILADMSSSMRASFHKVEEASEMLKIALKFPFVVGNFWGFKGTSSWDKNIACIYRFSNECHGYIGKESVFGRDICCSGDTPLHLAIKVTVNHVLTIPATMTRNIIILTDGDPCYTSHFETQIPSATLREYVKTEVDRARKHRINVYTLIIGDEVKDISATEMFGPPPLWKRTGYGGGETSVEKVLPNFVSDNFLRSIRR